MLQKLHTRRGGFTLVEIMIVVAIIALLAAIAVPGFLRARKRAQATKVLNELRIIDGALDQYALESNRTAGSTIETSSLKSFFKQGSNLYVNGSDIFGVSYGTQTVDTLPTVPTATFNQFTDVLEATFWTPYSTP